MNPGTKVKVLGGPMQGEYGEVVAWKEEWSQRCPNLMPTLLPVFLPSFPHTEFWWHAPHQLEPYEPQREHPQAG